MLPMALIINIKSTPHAIPTMYENGTRYAKIKAVKIRATVHTARSTMAGYFFFCKTIPFGFFDM